MLITVEESLKFCARLLQFGIFALEENEGRRTRARNDGG